MATRVPLTLGWIGQEKFLSRQDLDKVLSACGRKLFVEPHEIPDLETTLHHLTDSFLHRSFGPETPSEEVTEIAKLFHFLKRRTPKLCAAYLPMPAPPKAWLDQMDLWIRAETMHAQSKKRSVGRPANKLYDYMIPCLLGFYEIAYGAAPATTADGPTERFISKYIATLSTSLDEREFKLIADADHVRTLWKPPSQDALRSRIRKVMEESRKDRVGLLNIAGLYFDQSRSRVKTL